VSTSNNPISNLITIATFSGQSKYSADFQTVLSRAVQLRSLNLQMLQQQQQTETDRQTALQSLDGQFNNLQSAIDNLTSVSGVAGLSSSVSTPGVASVSLSSGAVPASYTLEVQSLGSPAQALSSAGSTVSDPNSQSLSTATTYSLTVGSTTTQITPSTNTLQGLVNAINSNSSLGVTASIVNVAGGGSTPDYRLSLQSTTLATQTIQLNDGSTDLLTQMAAGAPASYKVNGYGSWITSNSDTVTLAPGVTANLTGTNVGSPATITVQQDTSALQNAIQTFAKYYNAAVDQVNASYGSNANALQGDSILFSAQSALRAMTGYSGANGSGLGYLGLDLDKAGHLTFNASEFQASTAQGTDGVLQFLGDSTTGFIQAATSAVQGLEDPVNGFVKMEEQQISTNLLNLNNQINDEVDKVNAFQQNLLEQLSQSDAAIYQLESQATFFQGLFNYNNNNSNN
jgi:flagellar hook-associated protein 2